MLKERKQNEDLLAVFPPKKIGKYSSRRQLRNCDETGFVFPRRRNPATGKLENVSSKLENGNRDDFRTNS